MDKKRIALNSLSSGLSFIVGAVTIFFLYKYVLQNRGSEELGVWSLIISFTSLSSMGTSVIAGGVIKFVAKYNALGQVDNLKKVIDTNFISFFVLISFTILIGYPMLMYFLPSMFESNYLGLATTLVPISFLAFFVNSLAQVYLLSLDGLQYYYISQSIRMAGRITYLVATILFVPSFGLLGLAYAYFSYNLLMLILAKVMIHIKLPAVSLIPTLFDKSIFKEMLNYGVKFQVISFAQMSVMPTLKMLLKIFSSLSFVAYFEMAFQLVSTLKGGMTALTNVLTPVYASLTEINPKRISGLFLNILKLSCIFSFVFYPLLFIALPFISNVWIGHTNATFIFSSILLGITYAVSSLAEPQYILNLGSGKLNPNMLAMIIGSFLTLVLGYLIGKVYEGNGVLIGYTIAFTLANIYLLFSSELDKSLILKTVINIDNLILLGISIISVFSFYYIRKTWNMPEILGTFISLALVTIVIGSIIYARGTLHRIYKELRTN